MTWATPEARDDIADMLHKGLSASQIAAHFEGVTRNAVIGLVHRNKELREIGFARKPRQQNIEKVRAISVAATRGKSVRGGKVSMNRLKAVAPPIEAPEPVDAPEPRNLTLMELTERTCRWPVNDGGPFLFCGCESAPGTSWCAYHRERVFGEGTESERTAVRSALKAAA